MADGEAVEQLRLAQLRHRNVVHRPQDRRQPFNLLVIVAQKQHAAARIPDTVDRHDVNGQHTEQRSNVAEQPRAVDMNFIFQIPFLLAHPVSSLAGIRTNALC